MAKMQKKKDRRVPEWQKELARASKMVAVAKERREKAFAVVKKHCNYTGLSDAMPGIEEGSPICKNSDHRHAGLYFAACKAIHCPLAGA